MYEMRPKDARRFYEQLQNAYARHRRRGSFISELGNQSRVFFDDDDFDAEDGSEDGEEALREGAIAKSTDEERHVASDEEDQVEEEIDELRQRTGIGVERSTDEQKEEKAAVVG